MIASPNWFSSLRVSIIAAPSPFQLVPTVSLPSFECMLDAKEVSVVCFLTLETPADTWEQPKMLHSLCQLL